MGQSTGRVFGPRPTGVPIPQAMTLPLKATIAPFKFWLMGLNTSTGNVEPQAASAVNLVSVGYSDRDDDASTTAGFSHMLARQCFVSGYPNSTSAGDAILASDYAVPCWAVDNQTVGKLSNFSGVNRSMLGLALGIDPTDSTAMFLPGPIGWVLGRAAHQADNGNAGSVGYAVDASASTDQGTATDPILIPRAKHHGHITSIEIIPNATLAHAATDFSVLTIYKINGLTGVVGPAVGTFTTLTQDLTKRQSTQMTLSATSTDLDMLETDYLGYARTHSGAGAVIPQSIVRANMKVG